MSNLKKYMKVKKIILLTVIMQAVMIFPAYADVLADLKKTKLYTGTIDILNGISMLMLTIAHSFAYFVACIALVGFSFGGLLVVFAPMVKTIFGSKYYNRNYGLIFIGYGIGAFVGPKISASFFDATGSYVMGFIGSAILAAVAVLLVIVAKKLANKMLSA